LPANLESDVRLAGTRGHGEENAPFPLEDGLDSPVYRDFLVVARRLAGDVITRRQQTLGGFRLQALAGLVLGPEFRRRWKGVEKPFLAGKVIELDDALAVRGVGEFEPEHLGILFRLLQAVAGSLVSRFRLDHREGEIAGVAEQVIGSLLRPAPGFVAGDNDAAIGEIALFGDQMRFIVPAGFGQLRNDVLAASIGLIHKGWAFGDVARLQESMAHSTKDADRRNV